MTTLSQAINAKRLHIVKGLKVYTLFAQSVNGTQSNAKYYGQWLDWKRHTLTYDNDIDLVAKLYCDLYRHITTA